MKPSNVIKRRPGETTAQLYKRVARGKSTWNAKPTTVDGIRFDSKVEARVYERLVGEYGKENIFCHVRFPLLSGAPDSRGRALYMTVDFVVHGRGGIFTVKGVPKPNLWMAFDAKSGKRRSREWARGRSMFTATWGEIQEVDE